METIDYAYLILIILTAILVFVTHKEEQNLRKHIKQYKLISKNMDETIHSLNDFKDVVSNFNKSTQEFVDLNIKAMNKEIEDIKKIIDKNINKPTTTRKRKTKSENQNDKS